MPAAKTIFSKRFLNAYFGNFFEHYDTALYGLLSPLFAKLFFAQFDYTIALILTYALLPLGKISKPLGAIFFGYIADTQSYEKALYYCLCGIAITTFSIGLLPTNNMFAPVLLTLIRIIQSFFTAAEPTIAGQTVLKDGSTEGEKNLLSSIYATSTIAGILFASFIVGGFYSLNIIEQYWRLLYFIGGSAAVFALFFRKQFVDEPLTIPKLQDLHQFVFSAENFTMNKESFIALFLCSAFGYATYSMSFVLMNGFIPLMSNISKAEIVNMNTYLLLLDFLLLLLFGKISTYVDRTKLMTAALLTALFSSPFILTLLNNPTLTKVLILRTYFVIIGVWFSATFYAWCKSNITHNRCMVISLIYCFANITLGSSTSAISLWMYSITKLPASIGFYWIGLCCITAIALMQKKSPLISLR